MTQSIDTQVRGKAVYLEFVKDHSTTQVLIMPEGVTTSHKTAALTIYRRRLTTISPRKTWKAASTPFLSSGLLTGTTKFSHEEAASKMISFMSPLFGSLSTNGYKLRETPIVVEVTAEDLEMSRLSKTPYKAIARVWKARKALGFPKDYVSSPIPSTTTTTL